MGKGGKGDNTESVKRKKVPQPESSEQEDIEEDQVDCDQQEDDDQIDFDGELSDRDQQLLDRIDQEIMQAEEPLKLTWAAIHKIKEQQKLLNEKMDEQMRKIQQKFDIQRAPLIHKMAKIASGESVQKQIYTHHQLTKALNVNKHKPKAIPGFWHQTFESAHFIAGQEDSQILQHCTKVECETTRSGQGESEQQKITVVLQFSENLIISNKQLKAVVHRKGDQIQKKQLTTVNFKKEMPRDKSSFIEIFNSQTTPEQLYSACSDLQRIYNNSIFHYFYRGQVEDSQDREDIEEIEGQEEDDDSEQDIKPVKKKVIQSQASKGKSNNPVQKPQCKNQ